MSKDKESICVTVRVRPLSSKQLDQDSRICLRVDEGLNLISMNGPEKEAKDFYFDSVCDKISQNQIFQRVGKRSTVYCMEGYNCTIFAYGQTGAGKTYTMMGVNPESRDYFQQRGLIPRTLQHLFESIEKQITQSGVEYIIKCSFIQIYNEQIIDLLGTPNSSLNIREDLKKGVYIEGVAEQIISQSEQAMQILRKGSKGRHVGSTFYNQTSSRSHSVFTMQIQSQQLCNGIKSTKSRHFHFIDLAGSERTKKSMGDRLKQGCSINKSLHVLSMVISSLAEVSEGKSRHVNYRDSKLTFLLKDSLGGNSKTHLIANISPSWISSLETKSTLMFARKVKLIKVNKVSINEDASGNLQSLKAEIRRLRSENLLLRNGNTSFPTQLSLQSSESKGPTSGNNSKMVTVLQQYVDEEIEKQTKMQLEISKLQNKNQHLQKGIRHFIDNQKQLRMVLAIYEDKIKKLKKAEELLSQKLNEENQTEKMEQIRQYYMTERQILLDEIEKFKQLSSSSMIVKNLLRELKAIKDNPESTKEEEGLMSVLAKNTEFLQEIKNSIAQLQPQMQEGKASKAVLKQNEDLKQQLQEAHEKIEKYTLQVAESKDKVEQTQNLLNQAISSQINLEKKIEQAQVQHSTERQNSKNENQALKNHILSLQQQVKNLISQKNTFEISISQYELQISQINSDLNRLKQKREFEELNFQQKLEALTTQNLKLEQALKKKGEEALKYKTQSLNMKSQTQRINKQTEEILADASTRIQELEEMVTKAQNEKLQGRDKIQQFKRQLEERNLTYVKQQERVTHKNTQLSQQLRSYQQQLLKHQQQILSLKDKMEKSNKIHSQQKLKWEENQGDLIRVINEKKVNDSQTQAHLTEAKLQVISLNQKLAELTIEHKNVLQSFKSNEMVTQGKLSQLEDLLSQKKIEVEHLTLQREENERKIQILTESEQSVKRQLKLLEQQISYKQQERNKTMEQMEKIKKKQKQTRISINDTKNQMYALKKNYQIQIESLKQQLRAKEDQLFSVSNENGNLRQSYEKSLTELQKKAEAQFQVFRESEGSIKKAMETHLLNKQKKITELKTSNESLEQNLKAKSRQITQSENHLNELKVQINQLTEREVIFKKEKLELQQSIIKHQENINLIQSDHLKVIEEMENDFNESLDFKNAQIEKLRRITSENQLKIESLMSVEQENNQLKTELINRQSLCQQLENIRQVLLRDLEAIKNNGQQANNYVAQLEGQLKERQTYIVQLNQNMRTIEQNLQSQISEKQNSLNSFKLQLQSLRMQAQNLKRSNNDLTRQKTEAFNHLNRVSNEKESVIANLSSTIRQIQEDNVNMRQHIEIKDQEVFNLAKENQQMHRELTERIMKQQNLIKFMSFSLGPHELNSNTSINLQAKIEQVVSGLETRNKILQNAVEKTTIINKNISEQNSHFIQMVKDLQAEISRRNHQHSEAIEKVVIVSQQQKQKGYKLSQELKSVIELNSTMQKDINQLNILLQRKTLQIQNLQEHLYSSQKKAESEENCLNDRLAKVHQESTRQIGRLNQLYESSKQKLENMRVQNERLLQVDTQTRRAYEIRIQQLQNQHKSKCELIDQMQNELTVEKQKSEDLERYIDEQGFKMNNLQQQKDRISEQLHDVKQQSQKRLKQSEKRCQLGASQMNSLREQIKLIQDEASVWKQRMENLENQIRLSNDRAEKFRIQYMREKESNKEFKGLLQNAQCQIESFKNEAIDKDKLYHQLLEKVSKNDIERKGLMNQQDKKFSELLQKSRIQVSEMRKKYEDQLKINNLLKQQLQKKDVDVSVVRQRSQQYCRKQQQLMDSIRSDYAKIENELKSAQNLNMENKKALKKVTLKNEELEEQLQKMNKQHANLQIINEELKKQTLKTGMDERQMGYLNKLKEQNTQLKRQLERVSQEVISVNQEKLRLKSELRQGKDLDMSNLQLIKKISEVKYLQKIIDDSINVLGIRDYKKSVGQSLKTGIMQLQRELSKSKSELSQLQDQMSLKNQRLQILQNQKIKIGGSKEEEDTLTKMRNKINKTSSTFESIRQSKQDDKLILQMKDPNKANLWGIGRP